MPKPVVHLYTTCWDEADMLGFFFRHYDPWVDRFVVFDDGSTDGSLDILRAHPKVDLRAFDRTAPDSFVLSHKTMQDEAWKESRGRADWVVVTAIDEHLHVRGRPMAEYLAEQAACGTTLVPALGFDMHHPVLPPDRGLLTDTVTRGRPRIVFNKLSIFDPAALRETGFGPGRHAAAPVGRLRLPERDEAMLWHYKHLGFERNAGREAAQALRLGPVDAANGYGQQYLWPKARLRSFWDEMQRGGSDLARAGFEPDLACVRPLWWREPGFAAGNLTAPAAAVGPAPKVSVLVKAYNHAPYVRQTIESVLGQSFQDFEIVVTDDGSTDATLDVLRGFDDPRIRLEALPRNLGISAAMNATIARASGRYLAILNSDDWALPDRLGKQVAFLDAHPDVSLVFGLPAPVDEAGGPTAPFCDFRSPLAFPDFSRRTWLRRFFFEGNCLCAPTAMIRREAYDAAGSYDARLTNLQDLDMWVRMLIAGHRIHLLPDELTAFRIRAGSANMSAPRPDSLLRHRFETTRILRHFAALDAEGFDEVFGDDPVDARRSDPVALRVAELARRIPAAEYQNFALEMFYEHARSAADFDRLRSLAGSMDALGTAALDRLSGAMAETAAVLAERDRDNAGLRERAAALERGDAALREALAGRESRIEALQRRLAASEREGIALHEAVAERESRSGALLAIAESKERELRAVGTRLAAVDAVVEQMRNSRSWRSTAALRAVGRAVRSARERRS